MEFVKTTSLKIFSVVFQLFVPVAYWALNIVEQVCLKFQPTNEGRGTSKFKFALDFLNGQRQDVVIDGIGDDWCSTDSKRMKLLLNIDVLPDDKYEIITAQNMCVKHSKVSWIPTERILQMLSYYILQIIKFIRECIEEIDHYIHPDSESHNGFDKGDARKKISPRKKIRNSKIRSLRRFISRVKKFFGLSSKTAGIIFDPIEGVADISLNGSMNGSKLKASEKRKHPISSSSESDSMDDTDPDPEMYKNYRTQDTLPLENKNEQSCEGEDIHEQSGEVTSSEVASVTNQSVQEDEKNLDSSIDTDNTDTHTETGTSSKGNYFEVDDDYKSGDDPDYIPSRNESSSSDISEAEEDRLIEEAKIELSDKDKDESKSESKSPQI